MGGRVGRGNGAGLKLGSLHVSFLGFWGATITPYRTESLQIFGASELKP